MSHFHPTRLSIKRLIKDRWPLGLAYAKRHHADGLPVIHLRGLEFAMARAGDLPPLGSDEWNHPRFTVPKLHPDILPFYATFKDAFALREADLDLRIDDDFHWPHIETVRELITGLATQPKKRFAVSICDSAEPELSSTPVTVPISGDLSVMMMVIDRLPIEDLPHVLRHAQGAVIETLRREVALEKARSAARLIQKTKAADLESIRAKIEADLAPPTVRVDDSHVSALRDDMVRTIDVHARSERPFERLPALFKVRATWGEVNAAVQDRQYHGEPGTYAKELLQDDFAFFLAVMRIAIIQPSPTAGGKSYEFSDGITGLLQAQDDFLSVTNEGVVSVTADVMTPTFAEELRQRSKNLAAIRSRATLAIHFQRDVVIEEIMAMPAHRVAGVHRALQAVVAAHADRLKEHLEVRALIDDVASKQGAVRYVNKDKLRRWLTVA